MVSACQEFSVLLDASEEVCVDSDVLSPEWKRTEDRQLVLGGKRERRRWPVSWVKGTAFY